MGRDVLSPLGVVSGDVAVGPPERKFWNFQVKMQDFVHFYCEKTTCDQQPRPGGLGNPLGVKM